MVNNNTIGGRNMDISELLRKDDEIKKAIEDHAFSLADICRGDAVYHYTLDSRLNMTRLALRFRAPHKSLLAS